MSEQIDGVPEEAKEWKATLESYFNEVEVTPENLTSETTVLIAPGWSENSKVLHNTMEAIASKGRRVVSFEHPRKDEQISAGEDYEADFGKGIEVVAGKMPRGEKYTYDAFARAINLLKMADKSDGPVDVVAHSQGGIDVAIAASIRPDKFRNIVLMNPGGMIGEDTLPRLMGRFNKKMIKNNWTMLREGTKYMARNPKMALQEAVGISRAEIHAMLKDLKEAGIGISVIHGVDDPVFPMGLVQQIAKADQLDGFYSVKGGHDELILKPDKYATAAAEALAALERKNS